MKWIWKSRFKILSQSWRRKRPSVGQLQSKAPWISLESIKHHPRLLLKLKLSSSWQRSRTLTSSSKLMWCKSCKKQIMVSPTNKAASNLVWISSPTLSTKKSWAISRNKLTSERPSSLEGDTRGKDLGYRLQQSREADHLLKLNSSSKMSEKWLKEIRLRCNYSHLNNP